MTVSRPRPFSGARGARGARQIGLFMPLEYADTAQNPPGGTAHAIADAPSAAPTSLSAVARRLARRTFDLLAIGLVLAASLTLGRQVLIWWSTDPAELRGAAAPEHALAMWGAAGGPVELAFGEQPWGMTRQVVVGDVETACEALARLCRAEVERADAVEVPTDPRILQQLPSLVPFERQPGVWALYHLDPQYTTLLGVRESGAGPRLVCWGMMYGLENTPDSAGAVETTPASDWAWTLFMVRGGRGGPRHERRSFELPLPGGAREVLSLNAEGGRLTGFSGRGTLGEWAAHFDRAFANLGWTSPQGWTTTPLQRTARFRPPTGPTNPPEQSAVVQLTSDGRGGVAGLVDIVVPLNSNSDDRRGHNVVRRTASSDDRKRGPHTPGNAPLSAETEEPKHAIENRGDASQ